MSTPTAKLEYWERPMFIADYVIEYKGRVEPLYYDPCMRTTVAIYHSLLTTPIESHSLLPKHTSPPPAPNFTWWQRLLRRSLRYLKEE